MSSDGQCQTSTFFTGMCLQMGSVFHFSQFDHFKIFLLLQFIFLGSGTWINRPPSRAERRTSFPIWCEFGAYWCYWETLPWEVFDAFHEGLFECVAPYVVDDEVGGCVDDEAEVVDAGQTEFPGCRAWTLSIHVLPENGKTLGGKVSEPVSITHLAFFSTLRNSSKLRITRGMLLKRKTQTMHTRIIARFTFYKRRFTFFQKIKNNTGSITSFLTGCLDLTCNFLKKDWLTYDVCFLRLEFFIMLIPKRRSGAA